MDTWGMGSFIPLPIHSNRTLLGKYSKWINIDFQRCLIIKYQYIVSDQDKGGRSGRIQKAKKIDLFNLLIKLAENQQGDHWAFYLMSSVFDVTRYYFHVSIQLAHVEPSHKHFIGDEHACQLYWNWTQEQNCQPVGIGTLLYTSSSWKSIQ